MPSDTGLNAAQRKKALIAQGTVYRLGLSETKEAIRINLQADVLTRNALNHMKSAVSGALGGGFDLRQFTSSNIQTLLPFIISAASLLIKRRSLIKPGLTGAAVIAAAAAVGWTLKKKVQPPQSETLSTDKLQ